MSSGKVIGSPDRDAAKGEAKAIQVVGFRLDQEEYAIPITTIQEIIVMKPITRIPQVPASIEGLINLRGAILPIVNLRRLFGMAPRPADDETRTVIVNIHGRTLGYVVDEVTQVIRLNADQIQTLPLAVAAMAQRSITGVARLEERLLMILDPNMLTRPEELEAIPASLPNA